MGFAATSAIFALAFFFFSHFAFHSFAEEGLRGCNPFSCGSLKNIKHPFSNRSEIFRKCGLSVIDCVDDIPSINFTEAAKKPYTVENIFYKNHTIKVQAPLFKSSPDECHLLPNFTKSVHSGFLEFDVKSPILTLLMCNNTGSRTSNSKLFEQYWSYKDCTGHDLFFYNASTQSQNLPPRGCKEFHLPVSEELQPFNGTNCGNDYLKSLSSAGFYLQWVYPEDTTKQDLKLIIGLIAGGGGGILITCFIFFLISRFRKRKLSNISNTISSGPSCNSDLEKDINYLGLPIFTYSELEEATDNFDSSKELGDGGFGTVYHGKLRDGRFVAVKRLYEHNYKRVEQFMNEVDILTRLRHRNLVTLYGCTSRRSRELLLVYEYIPNGTVADHLHGDRAKAGSLTWPIRMNIAIETASALAYLHASDIIHRDVKTNNILLDNNFCVKVADFGLSRLFPLDASHVSTAPQGTPGYVDPEYHQCYQLTNRSDVYSFGVVLIELISSKPAVDISRNRYEINLATMAINKIQNCLLYELVDPYLAFKEDYMTKKMIEAVAELAFQCLQYEKDMRPSMNEVLERLKGIESENCRVRNIMEENIIEDEVGLVKNSLPSASPDSVADKWVSMTTTPNTSG